MSDIIAYLVEPEREEPIDETEWDIDCDADFDAVEVAAKEASQPVAIKWSRSTDGQVAFWRPDGACFDPYIYNDN